MESYDALGILQTAVRLAVLVLVLLAAALGSRHASSFPIAKINLGTESQSLWRTRQRRTANWPRPLPLVCGPEETAYGNLQSPATSSAQPG